MSKATTHIGSSGSGSSAYSVGQSRFGLVLVTGVGQSRAVPASYLKAVKPLFRSVVTVMAKWLNNQPMVIWS